VDQGSDTLSTTAVLRCIARPTQAGVRAF
jgi:hypothetical protein